MEIINSTTRWIYDIGYQFTIDRCRLPNTFEIMKSGEDALIPDSIRSLTIPNAGGSSNISEALSMDYMFRTFGYKRFVPEMEVSYWIESSMCDFLMIDNKGTNVGVSVTRAIRFPFYVEFTKEDATELLRRKLYKLMVARNAISEEQSFYESILHVWCYTMQGAKNILRAYNEMIVEDFKERDPTYNNVHVICTVCDSAFIYTNRDK